MEQVLIDYLESQSDVRVEINTEAKSLHLSLAADDDKRQYLVTEKWRFWRTRYQTLTWLFRSQISTTGGNSSLARNTKLGMRLPSLTVVSQCDGGAFTFGGVAWKWWVMEAFGVFWWSTPTAKGGLFGLFCGYLSHSHSSGPFATDSTSGKARSHHWTTPHTVKPQKRSQILRYFSDFHSFADVMGWGYWKVFADDRDQIYMEYAIIRQRWIFWPGRHVAWIGDMEDTAVLNTYFSNFFRSR